MINNTKSKQMIMEVQTCENSKLTVLKIHTVNMFEPENEILTIGDRKFITGRQMRYSKSPNREIKLLNNHKMNTNKMPVSMTFLTARAQAYGSTVSDFKST